MKIEWLHAKQLVTDENIQNLATTHTRTGCKGIYFWNKYESVEEACIG